MENFEGSIALIKVYFTDLSNYKIRPVLLYKKIGEDYLFLPLTTNLFRKGILIKDEDLEYGKLIKKSVVVIPKFGVIHKDYLEKFLGRIKRDIFTKIVKEVCKSIGC